MTTLIALALIYLASYAFFGALCGVALFVGVKIVRAMWEA